MQPESDKALGYVRAFVEDPPRAVAFHEGLSHREIEAIEQWFMFMFPV